MKSNAIARGVLAAFLVGTLTVSALAQRSQVNYVRTEKAFPTGDRNTSSLLLERLTPQEVRLGQDFQYEIRLTNLTRGRIEEINLVEQMPAGFNVKTITPNAGRADGGNAAWLIPALGGGETVAIVVVGSTSQSAELSWCATATFKTTACAGTRVVEPRLALKKVMPPEVMICDEIPIRVTVTNTGTGAARNVIVEDTLPAGLVTTDGKNAFRSNVGDLGAGQSREVVVVTRAQKPGSYTNTARAMEEGGQVIEASAATVVRNCALSVTKRGPAMRFVGRPATFDITVQNSGDAVAREVVLSDMVPQGFEIIGAEGGGQGSGGQVNWNLGNIGPNEAKTVKITLKPTVQGRFTNNASVRGYCCEATGSAAIDISGVPAILLECVDSPDPIEVGGQTTYEIIVTNQGTAQGTNIVIEATLPAEQEYVSGAGPTAGTVTGKNIRFAPLPSLAPKARAVYKLMVRGLRPGDVRFRVSMKSDQTETPVEETESTHIYE